MGGLRSRLAGAWDGIISMIKGAINAMIRAINGMIDGLDRIHIKAPSWVPGMGGKSWGVSIPHIPYLAEGGIVTRPTVAMVGEAGDEAVVPLAKLPQLIAQALQSVLPRQPQQQNTGPTTILVPVYLDGREIARATAPYMDQQLAGRKAVALRAQGVTG
jgi:phage-related protein